LFTLGNKQKVAGIGQSLLPLGKAGKSDGTRNSKHQEQGAQHKSG